MVVSALGVLLGVVTLLGGFASGRLHGAYRAALRDLRESERRLDAREAGHVDGRLEPELRWLAEVRDAARDARWRQPALLMGLLGAASVALAAWTLADGLRAVEAYAVVVLAGATVLVTLLLVLDGQRVGRTLGASVRRSRLWGLLQLENALSGTQRAAAHRHAAHRAWLRALAAGHPLAGLVARWRERGFRSAERRRQRAVSRVPTWAVAGTVLADLRAAGVRPPDGYVNGMRGVVPLVSRGAPRLDDDAEWDAALADLTRAVQQDAPRRRRWLSALAACAELRDDPAARESAARWTLDLAALGPFDPVGAVSAGHLAPATGPTGVAADRDDPLPDAALVEPSRPTTWAGALRRARETGARPELLASVLVRWAYALVLDRPAARDVDASIAPAVDAAVEIMNALPEPAVDHYLRLVRGGLGELGASGAHMSRLV
ncbi:MAG TPA: hypothetical protein VE547_08820, partial [Mycobacteriales bacterium]|nr:hypothetical protein [Mycobacteriales bacterium]